MKISAHRTEHFGLNIQHIGLPWANSYFIFLPFIVIIITEKEDEKTN